MIHIAPVLVFVAALVPTLSVAADTCAPGQRRLNNGEPCIPETLFNYLYCLKKSGDGKVEVASIRRLVDHKRVGSYRRREGFRSNF